MKFLLTLLVIFSFNLYGINEIPTSINLFNKWHTTMRSICPTWAESYRKYCKDMNYRQYVAQTETIKEFLIDINFENIFYSLAMFATDENTILPICRIDLPNLNSVYLFLVGFTTDKL